VRQIATALDVSLVELAAAVEDGGPAPLAPKLTTVTARRSSAR
jgi:hypothetical protein